MPSPFETFQAKLGIKSPRRQGTGFNYTPYVIGEGQSTPGEILSDKVANRVSGGENTYAQNKSKITTRLGKDLINKSAGQVPTDEFGLVENQLTDFSTLFKNQMRSTNERGKIALDAAQAKSAWHQANEMQNIGSYGFTGSMSISGTDVPGATGDNVGAKAVSLAMKAMQNGTPYVWGGNSLSQGVDCSGLLQQVYKQLGVSIPRTTYEQAKQGKRVSVSDLRPGDLVFYRNDLGHVGIYAGNGKIIHAANSKLGIIQSNLNNSNGAPTLAIRPY